MRASNRALLNSGIPELSTRAFIRDAGGKIKPQDGGGGGGNQTVTQTNIPDYAKPFVETALGKAQSLSQEGFIPYGGQQLAGFTPLQTQAFSNIAGQQAAPQLTDASNLAFQVGQSGLGASQNAYGLQGEALGMARQGVSMGQGAVDIGQNALGYGQNVALGTMGSANRFAQSGAAYGAEGANFGVGAGQQVMGSAGQLASLGTGYGQLGQQQAANTAGQAQQQAGIYGALGAGYGAQGANYGQQAANIGQRGVSAAEQGFGAQQAYQQMATSPEAQQAYMSPYMQNVVAQQQKDAVRQARIGQEGAEAQAVAAGAFGGSRQAIQRAEAQKNLEDRLAMIQATGSQSAFDKAQQAQQYGAGLGIQGLQAGYQGLQSGMQGAGQGMQGAQTGIQGASLGLQGVGQQLASGQLGLAGAQTGIQGTQAGTQALGQQVAGAQLGLAGTGQGIQGAQAGLAGVGQQIAGAGLGFQGYGQALQGQQAGVAGVQAGLAGVGQATGAGQYGIQGLGAAGQAATTLGNLGQTQFQQQSGINQAMASAGAQQQGLQQQALDRQYQDFMNAQNFDYRQLGFMSDMLRGLPLTQQTQTIYQNPSMTSQLAGLGTAGIGAYKLYNMKEGGQVRSGLDELALYNVMKG